MHIYVLIRKNTRFYFIIYCFKSPTKGDFSPTFCNFPRRLSLDSLPPTVGGFPLRDTCGILNSVSLPVWHNL